MTVHIPARSALAAALCAGGQLHSARLVWQAAAPGGGPGCKRKSLSKWSSHSLRRRNGELPADEESIPQDYVDFRNSGGYRTSLRTWQDAERLRTSGQRCVVIELSNQRGQYFVDGQLAMDFPVCTGTPSHPTPTGAFRISEKDRDHRSNLYHCAMPLFMRLTNDGIGLHVGDVFRVPASHGCIRLTREACATLFHDLPHGTEVLIRP